MQKQNHNTFQLAQAIVIVFNLTPRSFDTCNMHTHEPGWAKMANVNAFALKQSLKLSSVELEKQRIEIRCTRWLLVEYKCILTYI